MYTMATEAPQSHDLVERHNVILGYTVAKTIGNVKCDLELAFSMGNNCQKFLKKYQWI